MRIRKFYDHYSVLCGYRSGREITSSNGFAVVQTRNAHGFHSMVVVDLEWDDAVAEGDMAVKLFAEIGEQKQVRKLQAYLAGKTN